MMFPAAEVGAYVIGKMEILELTQEQEPGLPPLHSTLRSDVGAVDRGRILPADNSDQVQSS